MPEAMRDERGPMTIGIDAGPLCARGGISAYVGPLVRTLIRQHARSNYRLLLRRGWLHDTAREALGRLAPVEELSIPDRLLRGWWNLLERPLPLHRSWWGELDVFLATCLMAPVLPPRKGGRVVSVVYDLIPLHLPKLFPHRRTFRTDVACLVERSEALVAISERTRRDLTELMGVDPDRIQVIYPGRTAPGPSPTAEERKWVRSRYGIEGPYLLYVGSLGRHKNVSTLLRAYQRARRESGIPHDLVLTGSAQWGREVMECYDALDVRNHVLLTGWVPDDDLSVLYREADAFVFPSLYEGFGLPVLEAMSYGLPVIVSTGGALPEVVGSAGTLVSPEDEHGFANAIARVVLEKEARAVMAEASLARAREFSWERSAAELYDLCERVCRRPLPGGRDPLSAAGPSSQARCHGQTSLQVPQESAARVGPLRSRRERKPRA